jgi:hypothetical protein
MKDRSFVLTSSEKLDMFSGMLEEEGASCVHKARDSRRGFAIIISAFRGAFRFGTSRCHVSF